MVANVDQVNVTLPVRLTYFVEGSRQYPLVADPSRRASDCGILNFDSWRLTL
jgi:hypothetical protein